MRTADLIARCVVVLLALPVALECSAEEPKPKEAAAKTDSNAKRPRPKITISKETTYITGPLRADGYPDYLAAINQLCSKGVTPENNAAIPFWQAVGPKSIDKKIRKRYFELLGMAELPEEGTYLVSFSDFLPIYKGWKSPFADTPEDQKWTEEANKQFEQAQKRPWSRQDFLMVAALLERNAEPLRIFVEGARRSRCYNPVVPTDGTSLIATVGQSGMMESRELARCLTARAMMRLHEGKVAEAWQDCLVCHRWARLTSQGPYLIDYLLSVVWNRYTLAPTAAVAHYGNLTAEQANAFAAQLRALPPAGYVRDVLAFGERLFGLDCILQIAVHGTRPIDVDLGFGSTFSNLLGLDTSQQAALKTLADDRRLDWNEALRHLNTWYDRIVTAHEGLSHAERAQLLSKLDQELAVLAKQAAAPLSSGLDADQTAKVLAQRLVRLTTGVETFLDPALNMEDSDRTRRDLPVVVLALAAYRGDHGGYPTALSELSPNYIDAVPKDRFTDGELHYKPVDDGYLLYSVGPNGKDDGGRNYREEHADDGSPDTSATEEEQSRDDIAIRTPAKKSGKK